jgi:hypothetical protein
MTQVTEAALQAFKDAWAEADERGEVGNRSRAGLAAAFAAAQTIEPQSRYDKMRADLDTASRITNNIMGDRQRERVGTEALIDIAESLAALTSVISWAATPGSYAAIVDPDNDPEPQREQDDSPDDAPLEPGDVVALARLVEADELDDDRDIFTVTETGESEGAAWVSLRDSEGAVVRRLWASQYRRVPQADVATEVELAETDRDSAADLDDDFAPTVLDEHADREHAGNAAAIDAFTALKKAKKAKP